MKDFDAAAEAYQDALVHDAKADTTQVMHALGHSLTRAGRVDEAIEIWTKARDTHLAKLNDPKTPEDRKFAAQSGANNASKNLSLMKVRQAVRPKDAATPVDMDFHFKVKRLGRAKLDISGTFNLVGTMGSGYFDAGTFEKDQVTVKSIGSGLVAYGPRDGGRLEIRLHDAGYKLIPPSDFNLVVDPELTIMQELATIRGGRRVRKGEPFATLNRTQRRQTHECRTREFTAFRRTRQRRFLRFQLPRRSARV